jgi:dethiobiotin synthetase
LEYLPFSEPKKVGRHTPAVKLPFNRQPFNDFLVASAPPVVLDSRVKSPIFITGTNTGVGKTVFTCLFTRFLRHAGHSAVALKPLCSGGRSDAMLIRRAIHGTLTLDEINPWHFAAAVSPRTAARAEHQSITLNQVSTHVRQVMKQFPLVTVESAGGLLTPLGEDFDSRDLLQALRALPIVVALNQLGVINQVRLVLEALPRRSQSAARVVLMTPRSADASQRTNVTELGEFFDPRRIFPFPWISWRGLKPSPAFEKQLRAITANLNL